MYMGEVDLPSGRDATAPRHQPIPPTANMVRSAGEAFLRVGEEENRTAIGQQADAHDGRDDGRWAAVERRLDQADRARMETDARVADMMSTMMTVLNAVRAQAAAPVAATVKNAESPGAPGLETTRGFDQAAAPEPASTADEPLDQTGALGGHPSRPGSDSKFRSSSRSDGAAEALGAQAEQDLSRILQPHAVH